MNSQELSRELREKKYSCVFCDSVRRRLAEGATHAELETLFIEHNRAYHGLDK
ncbi:MAG: hypothetical protein ACYCPW_02655 [Nitrososphaerales archaeon]